MYVCLCVGVTSQQVIDAVQAGATTTRQVGERTGAGTVCGRCKNNIRALIAAEPAAGQGVSEVGYQPDSSGRLH